MAGKNIAVVAFGAGVTYCLYKLLFSKRSYKYRNPEQSGKENSHPEVWNAEDLKSGPTEALVIKNPSNSLDPQHLQVLLELLHDTEEPFTREQVLVTLANCAAFSVNQDLIRSLNGISVIGSILYDPSAEVKVKALNALNNLSMNVPNQEQITVYLPRIQEIVNTAPRNSDLQLAGLRLLTNMSVTNIYHHAIISSVPQFLQILEDGSELVQIQVLKVLVNLSANSHLTKHLLTLKPPSSFISLFDSCNNRDILLRQLIFIANLKENLKKEAQEDIQCICANDSFYSLLFGNSSLLPQKLASLLLHQDADMKLQAARILTRPF
ncbi:armadillo repeat-containing protein 10 [Protopterus annectens]|uniref:armadillo repeat-containing protein 10 n=1 Tax=Protopterus annectens TaxID=7888 RepID=UPI001CFA0E8F|nr:armadillo repeat-containing protein 10 [Protopterus annectens]